MNFLNLGEEWKQLPPLTSTDQSFTEIQMEKIWAAYLLRTALSIPHLLGGINVISTDFATTICCAGNLVNLLAMLLVCIFYILIIKQDH